MARVSSSGGQESTTRRSRSVSAPSTRPPFTRARVARAVRCVAFGAAASAMRSAAASSQSPARCAVPSAPSAYSTRLRPRPSPTLSRGCRGGIASSSWSSSQRPICCTSDMRAPAPWCERASSAQPPTAAGASAQSLARRRSRACTACAVCSSARCTPPSPAGGGACGGAPGARRRRRRALARRRYLPLPPPPASSPPPPLRPPPLLSPWERGRRRMPRPRAPSHERRELTRG